MNKKWLIWALPTILVVGFLALATVLPRAWSGIYLSPDETAVSVAVRALVEHGSMSWAREAWARGDFLWLRPRSFVTLGGQMVPVGFLGMPLLIGLMRFLFAEQVVVWFTPLLAASVLYPLWRLTAGWRNGSRWAVLLIWASFPTVLLYADRGLFPNLPQVCVMIWAAWGMWRTQQRRGYFLVGVLAGLALSIRPTEAPWIFAWLYAAYRMGYGDGSPRSRGRRWGELAAGVLGLVIFPLVAAAMAQRTYGSMFSVGYFLRDLPNVHAIGGVPAYAGKTEGAGESLHLASLWPFGFHPMHMLFNLRQYIGYFLAPWSVVCVLAAVLAWRSKRERICIYVGAFTAAVLLMIYGQSVYQDHVGVNVISLGNSFLRYLLPLTPFAALATGYVVERLYTLRPRRLSVVVLTVAVWSLASFGIWTALARDQEGIIADVVELHRYSELRDAAVEAIPPGSVILSERSDKIFFPTFATASPMPSFDEIRRLLSFLASGGAQAPVEVYYFGSTLEGKALDAWTSQGLVPEAVLRSQGQVLYHIRLIAPNAA